jgi:hypothetical protein
MELMVEEESEASRKAIKWFGREKHEETGVKFAA